MVSKQTVKLVAFSEIHYLSDNNHFTCQMDIVSFCLVMSKIIKVQQNANTLNTCTIDC